MMNLFLLHSMCVRKSYGYFRSLCRPCEDYRLLVLINSNALSWLHSAVDEIHSCQQQVAIFVTSRRYDHRVMFVLVKVELQGIARIHKCRAEIKHQAA